MFQLKNITCLLAGLLFLPQIVLASELTGRISTDPANPGGRDTVPQPEDNNGSAGNNAVVFSPPPNPELSFMPKQTEAPVPVSSATTSKEVIKVLGYFAVPDGSLIKDEKGRLYLANGRFLEYIANPRILRSIPKKEIIHVRNEDLNTYVKRTYRLGSLVRVFGTERIFVITKSGPRPIYSMTEIYIRYYGWDIADISASEFEMYI